MTREWPPHADKRSPTLTEGPNVSHANKRPPNPVRRAHVLTDLPPPAFLRPHPAFLISSFHFASRSTREPNTYFTCPRVTSFRRQLNSVRSMGAMSSEKAADGLRARTMLLHIPRRNSRTAYPFISH